MYRIKMQGKTVLHSAELRTESPMLTIQATESNLVTQEQQCKEEKTGGQKDCLLAVQSPLSGRATRHRTYSVPVPSSAELLIPIYF